MSDKRKLFLVGNAHLDPVWLWRWQEGFAEIKATFRSALDRMAEFPEFHFTSACAAYYKWVCENAPEMFEEIRARVIEGRWIVAGGQWIQPDCNTPSGEAFARHSLYSQRFFLEKFGLMAKVGYNVDSFGHNGMLPQILRKSGMKHYVFMRPDSKENKDVPGNLFWWESQDGSRVMTFRIPFSYETHESKNSGAESMEWRKHAATLKMAEEQHVDFMSFFGVGNHGGGPTIASLNLLRDMKREFGGDALVHSSPNGYFEEMDRVKPILPVVEGDLQHHASGCYSAHSGIKRLNRKAEHSLATAEKFSAVAHRLFGLDYQKERLDKAWQNVLFNQFHDIMGGCSIQEACEDAVDFYGEAIAIAADTLNAAVQKISWSIDTMGDDIISLSKDKDWKIWETGNRGVPLVVFNPLSWEVKAPVQVNMRCKSVAEDHGNNLDMQLVRASQTNGTDKWDTLFIGRIPAMGYRVYWIFKDKEVAIPLSDKGLTACENFMENDWVRLEIDGQTGFIRQLFDKKNQVDVLQGHGAVPIVIDETDSDTWAHGIFSFRREVGRFGGASLKWMEKGPLRAKLRVESRYGDSLLRQDFTLYRDKPDIEVKVKLDWREKHRMLKLSFPVNVRCPKSTYEIPFGFIERPARGTEEHGHQWIDVSGMLHRQEDGRIPGCSDAATAGPEQADSEGGSEYGLSLLNTAKYSYDVMDSDMRMTLARSPIFADHYGERDDLCEFMDQGVQSFGYSLVPHAGTWQKAGIVKKANELNVSPIQVMETYHKGVSPREFTGVGISAGNIIATAFKPAEDCSGYILRCYETDGEAACAEFSIPVLGRHFNAEFGRNEIKTFRISIDTAIPVAECSLLEMEMETDE
jgi:alpha-mannosidase